MTNDTHTYVKWFRNSAPYINALRGKTAVLCLEGEAIAHSNFANIVHDLALLNSLGVRLVLVHGARPQIEARLRERGLTPQLHRGLRVTDQQALTCVTEAAGSLRAQIEALLSMGVANSPMHGARIRVVSGNFVTAQPLGIWDGIDFGHTGKVRRIDQEAIRQQLEDGAIVLISHMGYSPTGEIFNLSAEEIAEQTAIALNADKLIGFGPLAGVMGKDETLIRECSLSQLSELRELPLNQPIRPLLNMLASACQKGVRRCQLISYQQDGALLQELFTRDGSGTLLSKDHYEQLRQAQIDDVGGLLELIRPLEEDGTLVKRSRERLEMEIEQFWVIERDGMVIAAAALYPYPEDHSGEIACVVTHNDYRGGNRARRLLEQLCEQARLQQLREVFVLTTRTAHWFQEQGFVPVGLEALPARRQSLYNFQRNSRVFLRRL